MGCRELSQYLDGIVCASLQIPCAAAGVLAIKSIAAQCHFVPIPFYVRKRPIKVQRKNSPRVVCFRNFSNFALVFPNFIKKSDMRYQN